MHSYKDLPTAPEPGSILAAVPGREDPRDALVARDGLTLGELPPGSTDRHRRPAPVAQLRALGLGPGGRPDPRQRGHPAGRVAGGTGDLDAVVLARAGLARLGRLDVITETLDPLQVLPAPAQGALAVECRTSDARTRELVGRLEDPAARACVVAERSTLATLEAGCSAPVAAYAEVAEGDDGPELFLRASVTAIDGSDAVRGSATGPLPGPPLSARPGRGTARPRRGRAHGGPRMTAPPPDPRTTGPSGQDQEHAMTRFRKPSGCRSGRLRRRRPG